MEATKTLSLVDSVLSAGPVGLTTFLLLIVLSVVSWGIIFYKATSIRRVHRDSLWFQQAFWKAQSLEEIASIAEEMHSVPLAEIFSAGYEELQRLHEKDRLSGIHQMHDASNIERALRRATTASTLELEHLTPFLATVGSTAPFIGLFGTVVGIINAFQDIAAAHSASLTTVAPGIAEALVATAAGLLAAIPANIAFNALSARIRALQHEMSTFAADYFNILKRKYF